MPISQIIQQDLSKGSNVASNPYDIGKQQSILLTNLTLDEHGSVHVRDGTIAQTQAPNANPIIKLFDFILPNGTIIKLAIQLGTSTNNKLYNRGVTPWTQITPTLGTKEPLPDILSFTGLALIVNGYETPYQYDGTTLQHITDGGGNVPAGGKHHALHQGYYWLWNTNPSSTTYDGPSSLRSSDLNNPNAWPIANQLFIDKDDGDFGMGMGQFTIAESGISPTTTQVLFKQFSAYQMIGVFGSTNPAFTVQKIKSDMGCAAPRTIRFAPGFGLIRLSYRGVSLFDGVNDTLISEEIRPLIFGSDTFSGIDWSNVALSQAEVIPNPPLYVLFCPTNGAGLDRVFCYDLVRKAWTVLQYPNQVSTVQAIRDPNVLPQVLIGDYSAGFVRSIFNPQPVAQGNDDGVPIVWSALLHPASLPSPQQRGYFERAMVKVYAASQGQVINWQALFGPINPAATMQKSGSITLPVAVPTSVAVGLGWGFAPWGTFGWGGVSAVGTEMDITIGLGYIADNARLTLSGEGHLVIRGIEWAVRPKPLVRPSVYV